jgi:dynein intermediate chain 2
MKLSRRNWPKFQDLDELITTIDNTKATFKKKLRHRNIIDTGVQNCSLVCGIYVTTDNPLIASTGVNHVEGGWPRDINRLDEEQTARYRKKQEKDEHYLTQMKTMIKSCEHAIHQNNSVNLYETYFEDMEQVDLKEEYSSKTLNMFRDKTPRDVRKIAWCPDDPTHFTSTHCGEQNYYHYLLGEENTLHIWDIEFPKSPLRTFDAHAQSQCFEYNPKEPPILLTGMITGQIALFDVRSNKRLPSAVSRREISHKDKVNAVTFYCSKTNMEFFSGSSSGEIFWWDLRYLEKPIETLLFAPEKMEDGIVRQEEKAFGVVALEYESTIPNKCIIMATLT